MPTLEITMTPSVPAQAVRYYLNAVRAFHRAIRSSHRKRNRNRTEHHASVAAKNYLKFLSMVSLVPIERINAPMPPHTEPSYD